jgi:hypothetical protein
MSRFLQIESAMLVPFRTLNAYQQKKIYQANRKMDLRQSDSEVDTVVSKSSVSSYVP